MAPPRLRHPLLDDPALLADLRGSVDRQHRRADRCVDHHGATCPRASWHRPAATHQEHSATNRAAPRRHRLVGRAVPDTHRSRHRRRARRHRTNGVRHNATSRHCPATGVAHRWRCGSPNSQTPTGSTLQPIAPPVDKLLQNYASAPALSPTPTGTPGLTRRSPPTCTARGHPRPRPTAETLGRCGNSKGPFEVSAGTSAVRPRPQRCGSPKPASSPTPHQR